MNQYIFDVDGTLTPSREKIDPEFGAWFIDFCNNHSVYLVTGSDRLKTIEQVGETVYNSCVRVYQCSGNEVFEKNKRIRVSDWQLPDAAQTWLQEQLDKSKFYRKTGTHIEHRTGMVNFSIVGRQANMEERAMYVQWDEHKLERMIIAAQFNFRFQDLQATIGGDTGIDIYAKGKDKAQIVKDFELTDTLWFFGDAMRPSGNDYSLSKVVNHAVPVKDWQDTWRILSE
jgi:phosphomannomutase